MLDFPDFLSGRFGYYRLWVESHIATITKSNNSNSGFTSNRNHPIHECRVFDMLPCIRSCTARAKRFSHRPISAGRNPVSQSPDPQFDDIPSRTPEVATSFLCERVDPLCPSILPTRHNGFVRALVAAPPDPRDHPVAPLAPECWRIADGGLPRLRPEADLAPVTS